jgi:hypothetical protein
MRRLVATSAVAGLITAFAVPLTPVAATTSGANGVIAFVRGTSECQDIELFRPSDGGVTKLTRCRQTFGTPAWSPDGRTIAVSFAALGPHAPKLGLMKATDGTPQAIATGVSTAASPVFSRSGSALAFAGGAAGDDGNRAIYTVPVVGGTATKLVGGGNGEANDEPDWSPTADVIAWSRKLGPSFDVWTMTVDASGRNPTALTKLTNAPGNSRYPSWSPDGSKLAFAGDGSGSWQIYVMNADGSNVVQLTSGGNHIQPAWSPDGTEIAFTTGCTTSNCVTTGSNDRRINGDLQIIDVTDPAHPGAPRTIAATSAAEFDAQWAPVCSGTGCPVTKVQPRSLRLTSIRRGVANGRLVATGAPAACHARVPLVLQYENAIDRGDKWPYPNRHWVAEGKGKTTSTGRFHLHLPPRLTGWYRVKTTSMQVGRQVCDGAVSRLRVNNFIRDPKGDSRGPVDIAWGDASIRHHVVTFTLHTYRAFSTGQRGTPCILFFTREPNSTYNGSIGCFGGLLLHNTHKRITTKRPDSRTIVYTFKEKKLEPGFTNFEWAPWSRGTSDHDLYDVAPNDSEIGRPGGFADYPPDMPILFKQKPTYHH